MAKIVGVFTGITGKVGNTIFQMLNGTQIMKTFTTPANPESAGQVAQRGVFRDIIACFKSIANGVIDLFWNPFVSGNKTGWGNFISANLLSMGKVAFDITKAILTVGSLEGIVGLEATYDTATGEIIAVWDGSVYTNGVAGDAIHYVVADAASGLVVGKFLDEDTREDETSTFNIATGFTATDLEVFAFLSQNASGSGDIGLVSDSVNCSCTAAA